MRPTDNLVVVIMHGMLAVLLLVAVAKAIRGRYRKVVQSMPELQVTRGESSMGALHASFAFFGLLFAAYVEEVEYLRGNRLAVLTLDWLTLAYLFYGNSWFRNSVFFRLGERVKRD